MQAFIDALANALRVPGDFFRNAMLLIPMPVARSFFIIYPLVLLIWVYGKERSEVCGPLHGCKNEIDIRPMVAISLVLEIIIYAYF